MTARHLRRTLGIAIALAGALLARPAVACTRACPKLVQIPGDFDPNNSGNPEIDGNAVAFRLSTSDLAVARSMLIEVRSVADGSLMPASIKPEAGGLIFSPDVALLPGELYVLRYDGRCPMDQPTGQAPFVKEFRFRAARPDRYPRDLGILRVREEGFDYSNGQTRKFFVRLEIEGPANAFQKLIHYRVEVDGKPESVEYPELGYLRLVADCDHPGTYRSTCGTLVGLLPGRHRVRLAGDIVGTNADPPPIETEVELACDRLGPNAPPPGPQPAPDQRVPDAAMASGCSAARSAPPSTALLLALPALLLVRARRRRSRPG